MRVERAAGHVRRWTPQRQGWWDEKVRGLDFKVDGFKKTNCDLEQEMYKPMTAKRRRLITSVPRCGATLS